jgi:ABC-2 type transport system permease protein
MRNIWTVTKREFTHYFVSPTAYAVAFMLLLIVGFIFGAQVLLLTGAGGGGGAPQPVQWVFSPLVTIALFVTPGVTMRLLAEEQSRGTIELLMTAPIREWELVVGKWLAAMAFMAVMTLFTLVYFLIANGITDPGIDRGQTVAAYLGFLLMMAAFLAIGLFVSSLFANQIAAFFVTLAISIGLWLIDFLSQTLTGTIAEVLSYLGLSRHVYDNFLAGRVDLTDVTYFVSIAVLFIFLTTRVVESRRWR